MKIAGLFRVSRSLLQRLAVPPHHLGHGRLRQEPQDNLRPKASLPSVATYGFGGLIQQLDEQITVDRAEKSHCRLIHCLVAEQQV